MNEVIDVVSSVNDVKKTRSPKTSKYRGVSKTKEGDWKSSIYLGKNSEGKIVNKYLGTYKTESGAATSYNEYILSNNINKKVNVIDESEEKEFTL